MTPLPERAQVVVVGGGVIGCSVAYHLAHLGWHDVVLVEQGSLSCGTTWHAAGLVGQLRASEAATRLVQYSTQLYGQLEAETGQATGYRVCGGLTVARTQERMVQLRRTRASAAAYGLECELLTPSQAQERYPLIRADDLLGAIWLPGDGRADPADLTQALAKGARRRGVRMLERVRVTGLDVDLDGRHPRVTAVVTDQGRIEAEYVVNCAGQWARQVAAMAGAIAPLHSAEHFYVVTETIDGVHRDLPILRDPDGYIYVKEEVGGLLVGGFEPDAKPWVSPDAIPHPFEFQLLEEDWPHFEILMDNAVHRLPVLAEAGIRKFYNGPESFTPDNQFLIGEAPEVDGLFIAAGFNSVGIASAGGAGRALAEWIVAGEPTMDLVSADIRRFSALQNETTWLRQRVAEVLGLHYALPWPNRELESARGQRLSPLHDALVTQNAVFGSRNGWERANLFQRRGRTPALSYGWSRPGWLDLCVAEQRATRESVAVFDQTSFSKYRVSGPDALEVLQWVCSADVDVPEGAVVYTGWLNSRGGYEADLTVTRMGEADFLLVSSAATTTRDLDWLRRGGRRWSDWAMSDVSDTLAVLGVMGPRSREVVSQLSSDDFSEEGFGFATSRSVQIADRPVRATRMTYVGELGWELYVPVACAQAVYDALFDAGRSLGIVPAGYYAIDALRLEKGYRAFGRELTPDVTPLEAGLTFVCKLGTDTPFAGREALESIREQGPRRRVVSLVVDDPDAYLWGGELIRRDGVAVGQVTSAAYGASVASGVALAYLGPGGGGVADRAWVQDGTYDVDVAGRRCPVEVSTAAPYDPKDLRVRPPRERSSL